MAVGPGTSELGKLKAARGGPYGPWRTVRTVRTVRPVWLAASGGGYALPVAGLVLLSALSALSALAWLRARFF